MRDHVNSDGIDAFLSPRSVVYLGLSETNSGSWGNRSLRNLIEGGYQGEIFPVHASATAIEGIPCFRSLEELPSSPDLCLVTLPVTAVPEALRRCVKKNVRAAVVVGSGYAESGTQQGIAIQEEIASIARTSRLRILGPNAMGAVGISSRAISASNANIPPGLVEGTVAIISQSGGVGVVTLATSKRYGVGIDGFLALGNEVDVTAADAITHFVDSGARVVLCYLESIRNSRAFLEAAAHAAERRVPIVLLKGGTQPAGQAAAAAHTASLAGSTEVFNDVLDLYGVHQVHSIEALVATGALFDTFGQSPGQGLGVFAIGGGPCVLLADQLDAAGLHFAPISPDLSRDLKDMLPDSNGANPFDPGGWFLSKNQDLLEKSIVKFAAAPAIDVMVYGIIPVSESREQVYVGSIARGAAQTAKPSICLSSHAPLTAYRENMFATSGVLELPCTDAACEALSIWLASGADDRPPLPSIPLAEEFLTRPDLYEPLLTGVEETVLLEDRATTLLSQLGLPFPPWAVAETESEVVDAARCIEFPLVLKAVGEGLYHRSQVGAVALGIQDEATLVSAAARVIRNAKAAVAPGENVRVLIAHQVPNGTEMIVGIHRDPVFGPVVVVGLGGVWSEILRDVTFAIAPVDFAGAGRMIRRLRSHELLQRAAQAHEFDIDALASLIVKVGEVACALDPVVQSIDLNPVIIDGRGAMVVDSLVVLARRDGSDVR